MAFVNIKKFLTKFRFVSPPARVIEKEAARLLERILPFSQADYQIEVRQPVVFVSSSSSAVKNELFLHQTKILRQLKEKFPSCSFQKVQFK